MQGRHNDYYWIEWESAFLGTLLGLVPDIVVGRYLINISFDSGRLTLSAEEVEQGWRSIGAFTLSPRITDALSIPHDQFDEWLVFSEPAEVQEWRPLVNYSGMSLADGNYESLQAQLWLQIENLRPESYLAEGDPLIFITQNQHLYELALAQGELDAPVV